jgi:hypothetical protein
MDQRKMPSPQVGPSNGAAGDTGSSNESAPGPLAPSTDSQVAHDLDWALTGRDGLRTGWLVAIFAVLYRLFSLVLETVAVGSFPRLGDLAFSPSSALASESVPLLAMLGAAAFVAHIEQRDILDYNLNAPRPALRFLQGLGVGFGTLSALVGTMVWGGWLRLGRPTLSLPEVPIFAALWGAAFLLVGLFEEGTFRCFLQYTLTRGLNFWWALGIVAVLCLDLWAREMGNGVSVVGVLWLDLRPSASGNGAWGVYAFALLGLLPCLRLHWKKRPGAGFWQAAWVTSTFFGFIHTGNNGENLIGIFAAALIGFVFCVSVRLTGSAWWAIGCHAAWDWAETYFYGTADSGMVATGHLFTSTAAGNPLWSGGADGPEGSLLALPIVLLLLAAIFLLYGRGVPAGSEAALAERVAGGEI